MRIDLEAPISVGGSIGGLALGAPVVKYRTLLFETWSKQGPASATVVGPMEVRYHLPGVNVGVDSFTGIVFKLTAVSGYRGSFNGVTVGMSLKEAGQLLPELFFDETYSLFRLQGCEGLCIETSLDDPLESEAWRSTVAFITITDVEHYQMMRDRQWQ
ncbi:MAG: hypothetical protein U0931_29070 [Vulcanimicrobiota bacterium]